MNLVDTVVTEVIGDPYFMYGKWRLKVKANSYGSTQESTLMFETKDEALTVQPGYQFDS